MATELIVAKGSALLVGKIDGVERAVTLTEVLQTINLYFSTDSTMTAERRVRDLLVDYLTTVRDHAAEESF